MRLLALDGIIYHNMIKTQRFISFFYRCGHCKSLAPVLDKVAPHLAGKMAIGKIDCTVEKSLCKKFNVRGYPTLKYYRDGTFEDYPLGRDADSIM